jgi:hypothetical protein
MTWNHPQYLVIVVEGDTGTRASISVHTTEEAAWKLARERQDRSHSTAVYSLVDTTRRHFSIDEQYMGDGLVTGET